MNRLTYRQTPGNKYAPNITYCLWISPWVSWEEGQDREEGQDQEEELGEWQAGKG